MSALVPVTLNGMNNKERTVNVPVGRARNAVNVQFSNDGEILFPRTGKVIQYSGNCKWLHDRLFSEGGSLKRLNDDGVSATVLKTGVGYSRIFYTSIGSDTYWANEIASGRVSAAGINSPWGILAPPRQPDAAPSTFGGMYAGDYRVAITWLGLNGEESATGLSKRITVVEGGGIHLNNFPVPPSSITGLALYVSSVNSEELYLYGEYDQNVTDISVVKRIGTIPLTTQFAYTPNPTGKIIQHMGAIYYAQGNRVYYTGTSRNPYGLQDANNYFQFDSNVRVILSAPATMYVNTDTQLYQLTNFNSPDGTPVNVNMLQKGSAAIGSECSDPDGVTYYFMSDRGFIAGTADGIKMLSYDDVAMPSFESGTSMVTESQGLKYLTFVGQDGTQNPLADSIHNAAELVRGSL